MEETKFKAKIFKLYKCDNVEKKLGHIYNFISPPQDVIEIYENADYITEEEWHIHLNSIIQVIKDNPDIQGILNTYDFEAYLSIAIFNSLNFASLKIPTLESFYSMLNKVYHRKQEEFPIKFCYFDIEDENWEKSNTLSYPFFMKPATGEASLHCFTIRNREELLDAVKYYREVLPGYNLIYKYIAKTFLDLQKFPLAIKNIVIVEELFENFDVVNLDGNVDDDGNIIRAICYDKIQEKGVLYSGASFPTKVDDKYLSEMWELISNLFKKCGFKNSSFNVEFIVERENKKIWYLETNPRNAGINYDAHLYYGYDLCDLGIKITMGVKIKEPSINITQFSHVLSVISIKKNKFREIFNLDNYLKLKTENPLYVFIDEKYDLESEYKKNNEFSKETLFCYVIFKKDTYEEIQKEIFRLRKEILPLDDYYL